MARAYKAEGHKVSGEDTYTATPGYALLSSIIDNEPNSDTIKE